MTRRRSRPGRMLLVPAAVVLGLVVLAGGGAVGRAVADVPVTVAVLGDSYVSGEGLPSAAGPCGHTEDSWGVVVGRELGDPAPQLVACTGAEVADVTVGTSAAGAGGTDGDAGDTTRPTTPQLAQVEGPVDVALLLVGGNDLGFADIVADCLDVGEQLEPEAFRGGATGTVWQDLTGSDRRATGCDVDEEEFGAAVATLGDADRFPLAGGDRGSLADVYVEVAETVLVDGGTLLVATYPALFAPSDAWAPRYGRRCHGVLATDADAFVAGTGTLAGVIADEATAAAERLRGRAVVVVADVHAAAAGTTPPGDGTDHGLCGPGVAWVNGLTLVEGGVDLAAASNALLGGQSVDLGSIGARPTATYHPNTAGHDGIGRVVLDALADAGVVP